MNKIYKYSLGSILAVFLFGGWLHNAWSQNQTVRKEIYVIPISGDVDPAMAAFLKRSLTEIPDNESHIIVIEMDTFGGRVDSALEMVDTLINVKKAKTIAYVSQKAISAGALISLAANELVMRPNTTIGDCAPIIYSNEGPQMMGEKFQSPLRAKFRTLARRNGYPHVLAEAMVTAEMEVYRFERDGRIVYMDAQEYQDLDENQQARLHNKKTVVAKGELLTMDDREAQDLGFSKMSAESVQDMLGKMGISDYHLKRIERSWSEELVSLIAKLSPILMLIGLGALYTEIKAPGFGAPGIIGIICLSLVFFNQYLVGLAGHTELLIMVAGIILMGFEIFVIPGFGIAGISGIALITLGLLLSFQDFVIPDPTMPWEKELLIHNLTKVLGSVLGAFLTALLTLRYLIPVLSRGTRGPYLQATLSEARLDLPAAATIHPGQTGTAITPLRPAGKADIDGEIYDVVTPGEFVTKGESVKVLKLMGNKITVTKVESNE